MGQLKKIHEPREKNVEINPEKFMSFTRKINMEVGKINQGYKFKNEGVAQQFVAGNINLLHKKYLSGTGSKGNLSLMR